MTVDRYIRMIAGVFIIISVVLGFTVSRYFFYFTAFVGLNLLQSAFTNWCPMIGLLRALKVKECSCAPAATEN